MKTGSRAMTDKLYALVGVCLGIYVDERLSDSSFLVIDPHTDDIYEVSVRMLDKELMGSAHTVFGTTRLESVLDIIRVPDPEQLARRESTSADDCPA